jgi:methanogenic corrinoid protein MtbC1
MYRWCSYCQKFLGEIEPKKDLSLTHGVCVVCHPKVKANFDLMAVKARPLLNFFQSIKADMLARKNRNPKKLLAEALSLGIAPIDLIAGMMQPLLAEIAELQNEGCATIRQEHEFSVLLEGFFQEIENQMKTSYHSDVLLACADGNYHIFGIRLIKEFLVQEGLSATCLYPSSPFNEIMMAAKDVKAKVVGISVSTQDQTNEILSKWKQLQDSEPSSIKLILGGIGLDPQSLPKGVYAHPGTLEDLKILINKLVS